MWVGTNLALPRAFHNLIYLLHRASIYHFKALLEVTGGFCVRYRALGYVRLHFVTWCKAPRNTERTPRVLVLTKKPQSKPEENRFFFSLKWALRDSFLPAWGVCNLSWGCCRYSSPGLSLFKMQTLRAQPLAAQQGICYSPRSLWGKRFVPLFLLFTEGTVCSGHFSWLRKYWWRNDSGFKEGCGWEGLLGTCI